MTKYCATRYTCERCCDDVTSLVDDSVPVLTSFHLLHPVARSIHPPDTTSPPALFPPMSNIPSSIYQLSDRSVADTRKTSLDTDHRNLMSFGRGRRQCTHSASHCWQRPCILTLTIAVNFDPWPWPSNLRSWPGESQDEPTCQISKGQRSFRSKVIFRTHTSHKQPNTHTADWVLYLDHLSDL